jgi:hypothetical protein
MQTRLIPYTAFRTITLVLECPLDRVPQHSTVPITRCSSAQGGI